MKHYSDNNFFAYSKDTIYLVFIDKNAAISGNVMKQTLFRQPHIIETLKEKIKDKDIKLGYCYKIGFFIFIVGRDNYHQKWNKDILNKIMAGLIPQLKTKEYKYKIDIEDYPMIDECIPEDFNVEICNHCEWEWN